MLSPKYIRQLSHGLAAIVVSERATGSAERDLNGKCYNLHVGRFEMPVPVVHGLGETLSLCHLAADVER